MKTISARLKAKPRNKTPAAAIKNGHNSSNASPAHAGSKGGENQRQHGTKRGNASRPKHEAGVFALSAGSVAGDNPTVSEAVRPDGNGKISPGNVANLSEHRSAEFSFCGQQQIQSHSYHLTKTCRSTTVPRQLSWGFQRPNLTQSSSRVGGVKKRSKRTRPPPTAAVVDVPTSSQNSLGQVDAAATTASSASPAKGEVENRGGIRRIPGVWTRRGIWAPANELSVEAADRVRAEGRRVGDRQRQRREDEVGGTSGADHEGHYFALCVLFSARAPGFNPVTNIVDYRNWRVLCFLVVCEQDRTVAITLHFSRTAEIHGLHQLLHTAHNGYSFPKEERTLEGTVTRTRNEKISESQSLHRVSLLMPFLALRGSTRRRWQGQAMRNARSCWSSCIALRVKDWLTGWRSCSFTLGGKRCSTAISCSILMKYEPIVRNDIRIVCADAFPSNMYTLIPRTLCPSSKHRCVASLRNRQTTWSAEVHASAAL